MKSMNLHITSVKRLAAVAVAVAVLACGAILLSTQNCYAETKVYENDLVKATVNDDGTSGTLQFKGEDVSWDHFTTDEDDDRDWGDRYVLTNINGTPLKDIIKFERGGYISKIWFTYHDGTWYDCFNPINVVVGTKKTVAHFEGRGPQWWGDGDIKIYDFGRKHVYHNGEFVDIEPDTYRLSLFTHIEKEHTVGMWRDIGKPYSDRHRIDKIEWWQ